MEESTPATTYSGARKLRFLLPATLKTQSIDGVTNLQEQVNSSPAIEAIKLAVPGPHKSKISHYGALLVFNRELPADKKFSKKDMAEVAGILLKHTAAIDARYAPVTQKMADAKNYMDSSAPKTGKDYKNGRYNRAEAENEKRPEAERWSEKDMRWAAGIDPSNATRAHRLRAPDSPATEDARRYMNASAPTGKDSGSGRYSRGLKQNLMRQGQEWPDKSMQKAAGITSAESNRIKKKFIAEG